MGKMWAVLSLLLCIVTCTYRLFLVHHGITGGEALQGVLPHLDADVGHVGIRGCKKLTLGSRGNSHPVPCGNRDFLSIDYCFAFACKDAVNFLIILVGMYEGHA